MASSVLRSHRRPVGSPIRTLATHIEPSVEARARWGLLASLAGVSSKARPADEGPPPSAEERKTASGNLDLRSRDPDAVENAINDGKQDVHSGSEPHHKLIVSACRGIEPSKSTLRKDSTGSQDRPTDNKAESPDTFTCQPQEGIDPYYFQGAASSPLERAYCDSVKRGSEPGIEPDQLSAGDNFNGRESPNEHLSGSRLANEDGKEAEDVNNVRYSRDIRHIEQGPRRVESDVTHMRMNTDDKVGCETMNVARVRSPGPKKGSWNEETWDRQALSQLLETIPSTKPSSGNRQNESLRDSPIAAQHSPQSQLTAIITLILKLCPAQMMKYECTTTALQDRLRASRKVPEARWTRESLETRICHRRRIRIAPGAMQLNGPSTQGMPFCQRILNSPTAKVQRTRCNHRLDAHISWFHGKYRHGCRRKSRRSSRSRKTLLCM